MSQFFDILGHLTFKFMYDILYLWLGHGDLASRRRIRMNHATGLRPANTAHEATYADIMTTPNAGDAAMA